MFIKTYFDGQDVTMNISWFYDFKCDHVTPPTWRWWERVLRWRWRNRSQSAHRLPQWSHRMMARVSPSSWFSQVGWPHRTLVHIDWPHNINKSNITLRLPVMKLVCILWIFLMPHSAFVGRLSQWTHWVIGLAESADWLSKLADWAVGLAKWVGRLAEWLGGLTEWVGGLTDWVSGLTEWFGWNI